MKLLLLLSLFATLTACSTATTTVSSDSKVMTLEQIAVKSQATASILEEDTSVAPLSINNAGRINNKEISAKNTKKTSIKK